MKSLFQAFRQPFPQEDGPVNSLRSSLRIGLFIALFLYVFRPFGLRSWEGSLLGLCLGFGVVTAVVSFAVYLFTRFVLGFRKDLPNWTLGKWLVEIMVMVLFIGIGNYLFMGWANENQWRGWEPLLIMVANTFLVGILPMTIFGLVTQMRAVNQNSVIAADMTEHLHEHAEESMHVELVLHGENDQLTLAAANIYYVEAMQNYVAIHYEEQGKVSRTLFRTTIQSMAEQLTPTPVQRCHRSYLVNTDRVSKVNGNAQGLRLQLEGLSAEVEVPVSRTYIPQMRQLLG